MNLVEQILPKSEDNSLAKIKKLFIEIWHKACIFKRIIYQPGAVKFPVIDFFFLCNGGW